MFPAEELQVSRTNTWAAAFPPTRMFVALDENATKRPSPLTACALELLGPFAAPPLAAAEMVTVEGVHPTTAPPKELQVS